MKQIEIAQEFSDKACKKKKVETKSRAVKPELSDLDQSLFDAIRANRPDLARQALESGASAYYSLNKDGLCALEYLGTQPPKEGQDRLVRVMRMAGAYFDHQNEKTGMSALHHAAKTDNPVIVNALISIGANIFARNREDKTPLNLAGRFTLMTLKEASYKQTLHPPTRYERGNGL